MVNIRLIVFAGLLGLYSCNSNVQTSDEWVNWCAEIHASDSVRAITDVSSMREAFVATYNVQLVHRLKYEFDNAENYAQWVEEERIGLSIVDDTLYQRFNGQLEAPYALVTYPFRSNSTELSMLENCFYASVDYLFAAWAIEQENGFYKAKTEFLARPID